MSEFVMTPPSIEEPPAENRIVYVDYAGFGKRFVAYFVDTIVIWLGLFVLIILATGGSVFGAAVPFNSLNPISQGIMVIGMLLGPFLYYSLMEASASGATLGKRAMGLRVTDLAGNRLSVVNSIGRTFGKFISACILGIGFLMIAFTGKKQGLHDMMAGTLVLDLSKRVKTAPGAPEQLRKTQFAPLE